jgi:adenine phosphoribosyltransferase
MTTEYDLKAMVRTIPDNPRLGIMFRHITKLLGDARSVRHAVDEFVQPGVGSKIDKIHGIETRGFIWMARWHTRSPRVSCRSR